MGWVGLFIVIVVLGALAGAESFGGTIRKGIGCLVLLIVLIFVFAVFVSDPGPV